MKGWEEDSQKSRSDLRCKDFFEGCGFCEFVRRRMRGRERAIRGIFVCVIGRGGLVFWRVGGMLWGIRCQVGRSC